MHYSILGQVLAKHSCINFLWLLEIPGLLRLSSLKQPAIRYVTWATEFNEFD
jgi:hypothetical protein